MLDPIITSWISFKTYNQACSEYTAYKYQLYLNRLSRWLNEQQSTLTTATPEQLERYTGFWLYQQKLKPQSRKVVIAAVRGFYDWLHRKAGLVAENPARGLESPKVGGCLPRPAQLMHAEKLLMQPDLNTFRGLRDAAMFSILIGCGCRVSGLCALNESDLIWTKSAASTERLVIRFREKGKKERCVPAPLETALLIRAYLGHEYLETVHRQLPSGDQVLFVNLLNTRFKMHDRYGERCRLKQHSIDDLIKMYGKTAGLPPSICHAHALRHLYGTELAEEDVDLLQRQALLGHADPDTTSGYTHLAMRKLAATVDKSNPMGKIRTPVTDLAKKIRQQQIVTK